MGWNEQSQKRRGFRLENWRVEEWNKAAILRHIWNLFARTGSIWVAWVHSYLVKGKSFWGVKAPQNSSWVWRKILNLRNLVRPLVRFEVGTSSNIFLWHDWWHPDGVLIQKYGARIIYDAASTLLARFSSVIRSKEWYWKPERSHNLVLIQSKVSLISISDSDQAVWIPSKSGHYTSAETRENIRAKLPVVKWWELIRFPQAIPRQFSIVGWLWEQTWCSRKNASVGL